MAITKIKLDNEIVENVNLGLGERFIESIEVCSNFEIVVNTFDYGHVVYSNESFFGETVGSAHDLIKYEVYNKYLVDMNKSGSTLYGVLSK